MWMRDKAKDDSRGKWKNIFLLNWIILETPLATRTSFNIQSDSKPRNKPHWNENEEDIFSLYLLSLVYICFDAVSDSRPHALKVNL